MNKITPGTKQSLEQSKQGIKQLLASQNQQKKLDSFSSNFRNEWRANTDCATEYVIPDCRNGRPPVPEAPAPTGKQPVKGSSGAAPPALDGTGAPLVGVSTGGTAIGQQSPAASGLGALGGAGAGPTQSAPLALGGAPSEEAGGAIPPGALGGGAGAPGGAAPTPVPRAVGPLPLPHPLGDALLELDSITRRLRHDCPWDREQDERSIVPHTVEEAYELADAAHSGDDAKLLDELGDVLFQVYFLALLLEERGQGDLAAVAEGRCASWSAATRTCSARTPRSRSCRPRPGRRPR